MINIKRFADVDDINVGINIEVKSDVSQADRIIQIFDGLEKSTNQYASRINSNFKQLLGTDVTKVLETRKKEIDNILSAKHSNTRVSRQGTISDINSGAAKQLTSLLGSGGVSSTVSKAFSTGTSSVKSFNDELDKSVEKSKNVEVSVSGLSSVIKTSLLVQIQSLYKVLRRTFGWMEQAFTAAGDYVESINLYTMSVGEYAEAGEKWATKIADALYLDTSDIYQYTGQFYNLTKGLGASAKAADLMSRNLTQLTYDMSSYLNIDVDVANTKLMSAMSGQTKAVTSVGIAVQSASLEELAYSLGIKKSVETMTQAEKTYLRYIQIMKTTTQMQGDLGRTIITPTNAMRLLRTQLQLLSRAIGQVLTPVIMEVIPYIMALTQVLKEAAEKLAAFFGYNIKDYLADASDVSKVADWFEDIGDSADDAAKKINRTLAPFDELNVVAKESTGAGAVDNSVLEQLEQYLNGYDMLQYYTDKMKKKMEALKKPIKDILRLVGVLLSIKGLAGIIKYIGKIGTNLKTISSFVTGSGKTITTFFSTIATKAYDGYRYSLAMGETGFTAIFNGVKNVLGPWGTLAATVATVYGAFKVGQSDFSKYAEGAISFGEALVDTAGKGALLTGLAVALTGPWGGLATAIGLVIGAVDGYYDKLNEMKVHEAVFDGHGVKIEALTGKLTDMFNSTTEGISEITKLGDELQTVSEKYTQARDDVDIFIDKLLLQDETISESQIDELKDKYDALKTATKNASDAHIEYYKTLITNNAKIRGDSAETVKQMISDYTRAAITRGEYEAKYLEEEEKLTLQWAEGTISAEEYAQKVNDLQIEYGYITTSAFDAEGAVSHFANKLADIDYGDIENLSENIETAKAEYDSTIGVLEDFKAQLEETGEVSKSSLEQYIENLQNTERLQGYLTDNQREILDNLIELYNQEGSITATSIETVEDTIKKVQGEYKGFMSAIYTDLLKQGADTSDEFKDVISDIENEIKKLKDVDMSGMGKQLFDNMEEELIGTQDTSLIKKVRDAFKDIGIQGRDELMNYMDFSEALQGITESVYGQFGNFGEGINESLIDGLNTDRPTFQDAIDAATKYSQQSKENLFKDYQDLGKSAVEGAGKGVTDNADDFIGPIQQTSEDSQDVFKESNKINSPSKVYEAFGKYIVDGLALGINENDSAIKAISKLSKKMSEEMSKMNMSFESSSFEKSLNNMLGKLQTFANKFSTGINNLLSSFTNSMNNVTIGSDNKIKYTKMPNVTIPRFEDGGYPENASLFYMNENGIPEMIGNIGNKTAVVNNDQIITSMTNALITALSKSNIGDNEPRTTIVKIGERTIYSGIGEYVDSENDRYGTNYVRV